MQSSFDFLALYSEIVIAFVAFATIVATLRQAFGERLTEQQYLLFRFFVETGFIQLTIALVPLALLTTLSSELQVWRISTYLILIKTGFYLPFYIRRRLRIGEPVPLVSLLVILGYGISILIMIATATEWFWKPSLSTTTYFLVWGLLSNIAIFVYFLGTFVETDTAAPDAENNP